ncbi:MAG: DSD1 family PLP-dependent enzyme [Rhodospirillales bacterium]|nr:DSD1 family PLP-dependent enzyme [Rhodospirillales bacterium]
MTTRPPAEVGMSIEQVDTPALILELDAFEKNLKRMADEAKAAGLTLRPHSKNHKCPMIARQQIQLGAVGVCCQKVSEAEAMVYGGVQDVYVSNEIVAKPKIERLAALARHARISTCVDNPDSIKDLSAAAKSYGVNLKVLVEVDVGGGRCGVAPGEAAVPLAQAIQKSPGLSFGGIQAYNGSAQLLRTWDERAKAIKETADKCRATVDALKKAGIPCELVSGAGTGTYPHEMASGVYNELQVGSYIFMDVAYAKNFGKDGKPFRDFDHSLFVLCTVMSVPTDDRVISDCGTKAISVDSGMPLVRDFPELEVLKMADEHGRMVFKGGQKASNRKASVGDRLYYIPGHCDPTVNMHEWIVGTRKDRVEAVWPVTARGPGN